MARTTRAVAAFHVQAAMERRLAHMKVRQQLSRPAHWRTEEQYQRQERKRLGWQRNPFAG